MLADIKYYTNLVVKKLIYVVYNVILTIGMDISIYMYPLLHGKCLIKCGVNKVTVTGTTSNDQETYIGPTENEFKTIFNLRNSSFKLEHKRTSTTLSDHVWKFKKQKHQLQHQMGSRQKSEAISTE